MNSSLRKGFYVLDLLVLALLKVCIERVGYLRKWVYVSVINGTKFMNTPKTDWFGYATEEMVYAVEDKEKEIPVGKQIQFAGLFPVADPRYTICIVADKHSLDVNPSVFQDVVTPLATWLLK